MIYVDRKSYSCTQGQNQDGLAAKTRHLVVVAGHSVTISGHLEDADQDERDWYLLDYQRHRGLPSAIVKHIQAGLQAAAEDQQALLVFSGGETRATTGPETEASSYYRVADAMDLWPTSSTVRARTITEEFATDSFENLYVSCGYHGFHVRLSLIHYSLYYSMFSICRFREVTGAYPDHITVVSFTFKQHRFETMHAEALQWPAERFSYIGVDPPASTGFDLAEATKGELENAAKPFQTDPYGCHSAILQDKRKQRNPFSRTPPYPLSCPEMKDLLGYCGPEIIAKDKVPWQ